MLAEGDDNHLPGISEENHETWKLATNLILTVCALALKDYAQGKHPLNAGLRLLEEHTLVAHLPAMLLRMARVFAEQHMTEYAAIILALVMYHPMSRKMKQDEAVLLLHQLEAVLPDSMAEDKHPHHLIPVMEVLAGFQKRTVQTSNAPEELSGRERDVLCLIAEGLSNAEIAQRLYVSVGTVKVHTRHIYDKLGVNSRTQALATAQKLGLL